MYCDPTSGALPLPYVPARVTRGALVAHRHSFAPPRCRTYQYRITSVPFSVSLRNDVCFLVFGGVGLAGLKAEPMLSCWPNQLFLFVSYNFLFSFLPWVGCVGFGSSD